MDTVSYLLGKKKGGGTPTVLQDKEITITENGEQTVTPDSGYDALRSVDVTTNVPVGVDINDYFAPTITKGTTTKGGWEDNFIKWRSPLTVTETNISYMFYNFPFNSVPNLNGIENVTNMNHLFYYAKPTSLNLNSWDTSSVTDLSHCFRYCTKLQTLNIKDWDVSNVTNFNYMFENCGFLKTVDLSSWVNNKSVNLQNMFVNCYELKRIDLSGFTNISSFAQTFMYCSKLEYLDISGVNLVGKLTDGNAFYGIPNGCEIIVKDAESKTALENFMPNFTNVKVKE